MTPANTPLIPPAVRAFADQAARMFMSEACIFHGYCLCPGGYAQCECGNHPHAHCRKCLLPKLPEPADDNLKCLACGVRLDEDLWRNAAAKGRAA